MPEGQQQQQQQQLQQEQGAKRKGRSSPCLKVQPNRCRRRCKSPAIRGKICRCTALPPQRGSSREPLPRSEQSRGERTEWWRSPV